MSRAAPTLAVAAVLMGGLFVSQAAAARHDAWPLRPGSAGPRVAALQWLLGGHRPAAYKYGFYKFKPNGLFGKRTSRAVRDTKWRLGYPTNAANQATVTRWFMKIMQGKVKRPFSYRVTAGKRAWNAAHKPKPKPKSPSVKRLIEIGRNMVRMGDLIHYSQRTRMQIVRYSLNLPPLVRHIYEDCSSWVTGIYYAGGLADPNDLGYNGYGFTGTLANHGRIVWREGQSLALVKAGDLIFYGRYPFRHVAMSVGGGRVVSQGGESGPHELWALYRSDAYYARRYIG